VDAVAAINWPHGSLPVRDRNQALVVMFPSEWGMNYCMNKNPGIGFRALG